MKTILVISYSNLATDPRVNRQIRWLNEFYHVIAAGLTDPSVPGVRFISLSHIPPKKTFLARGSRRCKSWRGGSRATTGGCPRRARVWRR